MIRSEERIKELYKAAEWSFSDDEFSENNYKVHSVLLDSDLEINFLSLSNHEIIIYVPVYTLGSDRGEEAEKLKFMSSLIAKLNIDYSVGSSVSDNVFRLELHIDVDRYDLPQTELLLQNFLDGCDLIIEESKNYEESKNGMFNHIPNNFLMS